MRSVDVRSLRAPVAFVADDSFLFSATVAENIAYARPDASLEEIELAARRAQAHGFIERLPDGYETMVGERGLTLSGGQRQRIAIARALLADPRILILDDATSSVDARTEAAIKRGLREAMDGRTTFIVAHRLSTISLADEIVVHGRRAASSISGTHDELLERCPLYAEIAEFGCEDSVFLQRDLERARGDGEAVSAARRSGDAGRRDATRSPSAIPRRRGPTSPRRPRTRPTSRGAWSGTLPPVPRPVAADARRGPARRASCAGCSACCGPTGRR